MKVLHRNPPTDAATRNLDALVPEKVKKLLVERVYNFTTGVFDLALFEEKILEQCPKANKPAQDSATFRSPEPAAKAEKKPTKLTVAHIPL